jgi:hypothetical protein
VNPIKQTVQAKLDKHYKAIQAPSSVCREENPKGRNNNMTVSRETKKQLRLLPTCYLVLTLLHRLVQKPSDLSLDFYFFKKKFRLSNIIKPHVKKFHVSNVLVKIVKRGKKCKRGQT